MGTASTALVNTTGTTEKAVLTSPLVNVNLPAGSGIQVSGKINILTGTGGTLITVKCYQGSAITGTQVGGTETVTTVAATDVQVPFAFYDAAPVDGPSQYTVSVTENSGTWTAQFGSIFTSTVSGVG